MAENTNDIKDLDKIRPIDHAFIASRHSHVYLMHRYFARRPWSVFSGLIEHYSNPGSVVLDPFCGGGVTVVEGLRLGRKVIGVDLSPIATFVTQSQCSSIPDRVLLKGYEHISARLQDEIEDSYKTQCPNCSERVETIWYEVSHTVICPKCDSKVILSSIRKKTGGKFTCPSDGCNTVIRPLNEKSGRPVVIRKKVSCPNCKTFVGCSDRSDQDNLYLPSVSASMLSQSIWSGHIPTQELPDGDLVRDHALHKKQFLTYSDFYCRRNLINCAKLAYEIDQLDDQTKPAFQIIFSSMLFECASFLCHIKDGTVVKPGHHFWPPYVFAVNNVWKHFERRFKAIRRGMKWIRSELGDRFVTNDIDALPDADAVVLTQSSEHIPLGDNQVDVIITDPPYGGNVQYGELSDFFLAWTGRWIQCNRTEKTNEAISTRHSGFSHAKDSSTYRDTLHRIFAECHRVLRSNGWMVMTFHNKEFEIWSALHLAAHDAGFILPEHDGMVYQPPILDYTTVLHQQADGSMLGDFILSFQKVDYPPEFKAIDHSDTGRHIEKLAAEAVIYHNGATLSTIYMKLIPFLLNNNLLEEISEKEVVPYLQNNFHERDGKWHLNDDPEAALRDELEQYSKEHYKASYSDVMRTVPVEARLEFLIRRFLYKNGYATQDEVLNVVYTNLINSNAADYGEIQRVLTRIAELADPSEGLTKEGKKGKKKRKVWRLKEDIEREQLWAEVGADVKIELETTQDSDHDLAINRLIELAGLRGLKSHVGRAERAKYADFRRNSELPKRVKGLPQSARNVIEQIDVLWHNGGKGVVAAFEVEKSTTIVSGIQRMRDLMAAMPDTSIELYIVIPKSRGNELRGKLGSPANRKDGLLKKIGYIYLEDLNITSGDASKVEFEKIIHYLNGGN